MLGERRNVLVTSSESTELRIRFPSGCARSDLIQRSVRLRYALFLKSLLKSHLFAVRHWLGLMFWVKAHLGDV